MSCHIHLLIFCQIGFCRNCYDFGQSDQLDQKDQKLQNRLIFKIFILAEK
jgi:hypothetical protein